MKRFVLISAISLFAFVSCYDDYIIDYDYQGVGFANQTDVRSVVVGEGMTFSTGVALGGVISNEEDRTVSYSIDNTLINESTLTLFKSHALNYITALFKNVDALAELPSSEYTLVNDGGEAGKTVIRKGSHLGTIQVKVDSLAYFQGSASLSPDHVIPITITDGGGTDLIEGKNTTVIGVRYENMLFGNYWHGGKAEVEGADGSTRTVTYYTEVPQSDNEVWTLTTVGPHSLTANAIGNELNGSAAQMRLTLNQEDGTITVASVDGAPYTVEADGESRYNRAALLQDRKIFLKYKFVKDGETWHATDTLTFRNRIRDGVNEWQDENPEHYN